MNNSEGGFMKSLLEKLFRNEEQPKELNTPKNIKAHFVLMYDGLEVGYLNYDKGNWIFEYSDMFKKQDEIEALVDFPNKEKRYERPFLWPFFAHRIPGLGQPKVQRIIREEKINPDNEVDLLHRFGRKSIANPFELVA